jgi:hypothetical protein
VVGIAHRYGLEGAEILSGGGQFFRTSPDRPWAYLAKGHWVIHLNPHSQMPVPFYKTKQRSFLTMNSLALFIQDSKDWEL